MDSLLRVLQKKNDISNMGISALTSHLSGQKHSEIASLRKSQTGAFSGKNLSQELQKVEAQKLQKLRIWLYLLVRFGHSSYGH